MTDFSTRAKQRGKGAPKKKRTAEGKHTSLRAVNTIAANQFGYRVEEVQGQEEACDPSCGKSRSLRMISAHLIALEFGDYWTGHYILWVWLAH